MASKAADADTVVRLNINLTSDSAGALRRLADDQHITMTEAVRRAIGVLTFVHGEISQGRKLVSIDPDGKERRELVFV